MLWRCLDGWELQPPLSWSSSPAVTAKSKFNIDNQCVIQSVFSPWIDSCVSSFKSIDVWQGLITHIYFVAISSNIVSVVLSSFPEVFPIFLHICQMNESFWSFILPYFCMATPVTCGMFACIWSTSQMSYLPCLTNLSNYVTHPPSLHCIPSFTHLLSTLSLINLCSLIILS